MKMNFPRFFSLASNIRINGWLKSCFCQRGRSHESHQFASMDRLGRDTACGGTAAHSPAMHDERKYHAHHHGARALAKLCISDEGLEFAS